MSNSREEFYFLSPNEVKFFHSFCSLIVPSGSDPASDPGAREVGAVHYVDSTLLDFPKKVQEYFRGAVDLVNQRSRSRFQDDFSGLSIFNKNWILRDLFLDPKTRERIFDLRSLALEGFYSDYHDPSYQGISAWGLVHFQGRRISGIKKDWSFLKIWRDALTQKKG